jgi:hypothetical protein
MASRVVDITKGLTGSNVGAPVELLRPKMVWEGANEPLVPSSGGASKGYKNELRDPNVFTDVDGQDYLLYSVAGEKWNWHSQNLVPGINREINFPLGLIQAKAATPVSV